MGQPLRRMTLGNGNLYGTTYSGGSSNAGTVYKLQPKGSGWTFSPLYAFTGGGDGANPAARVIFGPDGVLYGTTLMVASETGHGFQSEALAQSLQDRALPMDRNRAVRLHLAGADGGRSWFGDLIFDEADNIYGTTSAGGCRIGRRVAADAFNDWGTRAFFTLSQAVRRSRS